MKNTMTRAWELYEQGRAYNDQLEPNQYSLVNTNIEFFHGNQWLHMPDTAAMRRLPKPVFNIIKRVASLFVASLTSSGAAIYFEPLDQYGTDQHAAQCATAEVSNLLEKFKMEYRIREALFDGAQTGDYCAHFYWDPEARPYGGALSDARGEIVMELVDGINVMFGNPADSCVERQPYILLLGRDTVESLRQEAKELGGQWEDIRPDSEFGGMAGQGGRIELTGEDTGKALYVYLYTKGKNDRGEETVRVTKATRNAVIYEDVDTGLSRYPIAWGNWEKQKNQYHGRALVPGIIPHQIVLNTMFAMVMRHLQLMGFPKTVYNADLIGAWNNDIGQAIGVRGLQPGQPITQVAAHLQPADMSAQILTVIDRAVSYTKDCLGATDAQMGNVKPDNTSALMVLQSSAEVPLENTRAGLYEWLEDVGAILLDMMGTYYGLRPLVRERELQEPVLDADGAPRLTAEGTMALETVTRRVVEQFDFGQFKHLWLKLRVDVGASSCFSEIAMTQTLDNLRANGTLDIIQYLERVPDKLIPRKAELVEELKKAQKAQAEQARQVPQKPAAAQVLPVSGGSLSADKILAQEPGRIQAAYQSLPKVAQRAIVKKGRM